MNIKIQSRNFLLTDALRNQVLAKLNTSLERFGHRIRKIEVTLSDVNGPKGGEDKKCVIKMRINHLKTIVVMETSNDMYLAIAHSASKVRRTLDKQYNRSKKFTRNVTFA